MIETFSKDNIIFMSGWIKEGNEIKVISVPYFMSSNEACINLMSNELFTMSKSTCAYDVVINAFEEQYQNYNKYDINDLSFFSNRIEVLRLPDEYKNKEIFDMDSILFVNDKVNKQSLSKLRTLFTKGTSFKYDNDRVYLAINKMKENYIVTPYFIKNNNTIVNIFTNREYMVDKADISAIEKLSEKENKGEVTLLANLVDEYKFHANHIKDPSAYAAVLKKLWRGKSSQAEIEAIAKYLKMTCKYYDNRDTNVNVEKKVKR